jgi:rhamnogalacturonyl hydrolase YesR
MIRFSSDMVNLLNETRCNAYLTVLMVLELTIDDNLMKNTTILKHTKNIQTRFWCDTFPQGLIDFYSLFVILCTVKILYFCQKCIPLLFVIM